MSFAFLKSDVGDLSEPPALTEQQLRRLWLGLPIAACGLVSTLLAAGLLFPLALNLSKEWERVERLQRLREQLTDVKLNLARSQVALRQADAQTSKLRNLLVGGGDRGTVLATLDTDAKATGVSLALYEQNLLVVAPGATPAKPGSPAPGAKPIPPAGTAAPAPGTAPAPGSSPALGAVPAEGVVENPLLLSVQGTFPQILAFMKRLEQLQVLVKQQDLSLAMAEKPAGGPASAEVVASPGSSPILVMKLSLVVFDAPGDDANANPADKSAGKTAGGPRSVLTPTGGPPPGVTPPSRPGPAGPPGPRASAPPAPAASPAGSSR
jgi:hypothetical protein